MMKTTSLKGYQAASAITPLSSSALVNASFPGRNFRGEYSPSTNYAAGDVIAYKSSDTSDPIFLEAKTTIVAGFAFDLTKWQTTEPSGGSEYYNAEMRELFNLIRYHSLEFDKWTKQRIQQGVVTIYNKYVVSGAVVKAVASTRNVSITATGTYSATGSSMVYISGQLKAYSDNAAALTIPAGGTADTLYHVCLTFTDGVVKPALVANSDINGPYLKLYSIKVPANDAATDLTACTITDERRVESKRLIFYNSIPYALVSIPGYIMPDAPEYSVECDVESASEISAVGMVKVYDKANNGFKITYTGSADNVTVRYTIINPDV